MKRRNFLQSAAMAGLGLPSLLRQAQAKPCPPPTVSAIGGTSSGTGCLAPAQQPSYMTGMSDFQVRHLTTVTGGSTTMFDTLPSEWRQTGQPNGADNVFGAWSGGASDPASLRLFVHGGGHFDSSNNGLYVYDFAGNSAPVGWSLAPNSLSALSVISINANVYSDGHPAAVHTYGGLWFDPNLNRFYRFGGSKFSDNGAGTGACFYYDFNTRAWVQLAISDFVAVTLGSTLVGSPDGNNLLYLASTKSPVFANPFTGAMQTSGNALSGSQESGFSSAMDTTRSNVSTGVCRYCSFHYDSAGPRVKVITVNWRSNTWSMVTQTLTGNAAAALNVSGNCVAYDPQRDSFWVFAGADDTDDGAVTAIYEVNASNFTVSNYALSAPIPAVSGCRGGFNRHIWFPNWRIIGTVHAHDKPMSLIKVP